MWQDARYAWRLLVRAPAFTGVAVLTLALGIGANTAIFSVARSVLLAPLPFADPDRLVALWEGYPPNMARAAVSVPAYFDLREARQLFSDVATFRLGGQNLTGSGEPERVVTARVSQSFAPTLGLTVERGRWFTVEEDQPNRRPVVVLTDGFWRRRFGGDPNVIGQTLLLDERPHDVVGILLPASTFPRQIDVYVPIAFAANQRAAGERGSQFLDVIARVRNDVAMSQVPAGVATLARRLQPQYYPDTPRWTLGVRALKDDLVRDARPILVAVSVAVGLVLLIACANVANLLLARAGHRRTELAVRAAVGASAGRLRRQLVIESTLLGALGGVAGAILASACVPLLAGAVAKAFPQVDAPRVDVAIFAFAIMTALVSSALFGLVPAWQLSQGDLRSVMSETSRGGTASHRARQLLVVGELALAFSVLIAAGLLVRSFARVAGVDPGFAVDRRLSVRVSLPVARYSKIPRAAFYEQFFDRLSSIPGVRAAGGVSELPFSDLKNMGTFAIQGRQPAGADLSAMPHADWRSASGGYFVAMGIRLVDGRLFDSRDVGSAPLVAIIDEVTAAKYFAAHTPIGQHISIDDVAANHWAEIVGVVRAVHHDALDMEPRGTLYLPLAQRPTNSSFAIVHTDADPLTQLTGVRAAIHEIDPQLPIFDVQLLDVRLTDSLGRRRVATALIGVFAALAVALAAVGVYGVIAYDVSQRAREIGIRMALGADARSIIAMVIGGGLRMAATGVGSGALLALGLTHAAGSLLFGISGHDPATYVTLGAALLALTLGASYIPARRAAAINPIETLR
jgi:putative ABC transport system permease protein